MQVRNQRVRSKRLKALAMQQSSDDARHASVEFLLSRPCRIGVHLETLRSATGRGLQSGK